LDAISTNPNMNEEERRKVFWLLRKYSSHTAWDAFAQTYYDFSDAWMIAMRSAEWGGDAEEENDRDWTKSILDGRVAFEKGMRLLRQGDRSVWRENSRGYLSAALDSVVFINRIMNPEEYVFDWMENKVDVVDKHRALSDAFNRLGAVVEQENSNDAAPMGLQTVFDPYFGPFNYLPSSLKSQLSRRR
jgi:Immunity protein 71